MSTYSHFENDPSIERDGFFLDMGQAGRFRIARAGGANEKFQALMARLTKPHRRAIQAGALDPKINEDIVRQAYAEGVLRGWEGVTDREGKELPFNKENAIKLFTDLPDLYEEIIRAANHAAYFRITLLEEDAKNS